jgi:2',3'-cyclic-nucleotide 2'-phosphodiesterase (5'-nucleotidase family)
MASKFNTRFFATLTGLLASSLSAHARPLQIIHTNDLHSHLDHASDTTRGGYAAVKAVIDQLKGEAHRAGIETLVLDAGDFTEDSQYYLANQGLESWHAMDAMGYDAVTIGNHDWFAGMNGLDEIVGRANPSFPLLGANFIFTWDQKNLVKHMRQYVELERAGSKIAIYGLTTDDWQYGWMADPGFIYKPEWTAQEDLPKIRARNDYVIALTHLGTTADKRLVKRVKGIDLVVGGHSHTSLKIPLQAQDPSGKTVPIVQTGMHGRNVGDLLVDVEPGKPLQILRYRLIPVASNGPQDGEMIKIVQHARDELNRDYGTAFLNEIVGFSEVPLENAYYKDEATTWSKFVASAIRTAGQADASIDVTQFEGFDLPPGPITREQLFVLYPRMFEFKERYGWTVWTTDVAGWAIQFTLQKAIAGGLPIQSDGITYELDAKDNPINMKINGQPIVAARNYKIAMPSGIIRGAFGLTKFLDIVLKNAHDTQIPIWFANEKKLRALGTIKADPSAPRSSHE